MYCTNCGGEITENNAFCTECGASLTAPAVKAGSTQAQTPIKKNRKTGAAIAVGAACLLVIVGIGFFFANGQGGSDQTAINMTTETAQVNGKAGDEKGASASSVSSANSASSTNGVSGGGKKLGNGTDYAGSASSSTQTNSTSKTGEVAASNSDAGETLTVEAADGAMLSGSVRKDASGYVIADSSTVEYTVEELRAMNLSDAELCIAWNEPFARQGYHFKNPGLQAYFQACSWYTDTGNSSSLTGAAAVNNSRLRQIAEENASSRRWEELAT